VTGNNAQRNRRALILLVFATVLYFFTSFLLLPWVDQLRAASSEVADKTDRLRRFKRQLAHRNNYAALTADARRKLQEATTHFFTVDADGTAEFQKVVEDGAKGLGINLAQRSATQTRKADELVSEIAMTLSFECTPGQLVAFMGLLRTSPKVVNVKAAQVDPVQAVFELPKTGELRKNLRVNLTVAGLALAGPQSKAK
jgi:hypothetical protein